MYCNECLLLSIAYVDILKSIVAIDEELFRLSMAGIRNIVIHYLFFLRWWSYDPLNSTHVVAYTHLSQLLLGYKHGSSFSFKNHRARCCWSRCTCMLVVERLEIKCIVIIHFKSISNKICIIMIYIHLFLCTYIIINISITYQK